MIIKNKLTREKLDITYPEFRKKFQKEVQAAFESYRKTQLNKYSYNFTILLTSFWFLKSANFLICKRNLIPIKFRFDKISTFIPFEDLA